MTGEILNGKLQNVFSLMGYRNPKSIVIVGCGGTGAYVIPHLARIISIHNKRNIDKINLILADGDSVEDKNLLRQNFINIDIDRNKAEVLAERYSAAFGVSIDVIPKYLENYNDLNFLPCGHNPNIVVGCVDNHATRLMINEWFTEKRRDYIYPRFWIDSGNEEHNGQVVCGYAPTSNGYYVNSKINPYRSLKSLSGEFSLPTVVEIYPDILKQETKFNSELSCAERALSSPQNIQTNIMAGTIILSYLNKIIYGEGIKSHCVEFNISNSFSTKLNTKENLSVIKKERLRDWEK